MRLSPVLPAATLLLLGACAQIQSYGAAALQQRRTMNDMQARLSMAATCDIALGSYFRELSEIERQYVGLVCGGIFPTDEATTSGTTPVGSDGSR